jgi:hypothetical protein
MSFHDAGPVHHATGELYVKREGDTILVYPGPARLTLSEWSSVVAFTTPTGDNQDTFAKALALIEGRELPAAGHR